MDFGMLCDAIKIFAQGILGGFVLFVSLIIILIILKYCAARFLSWFLIKRNN
jgi:hypothetical protein